MVQQIEPSRMAFGRALGDLLRDKEYVTRSGNINWHAFATDKLEGVVHYESLRKAVAGERQPTPHIMEVCADALGVDPSYFAEYRIYQAERQFNVTQVGFEQALDNLDRWASAAAENGVRSRKRRA